MDRKGGLKKIAGGVLTLSMVLTPPLTAGTGLVLAAVYGHQADINEAEIAAEVQTYEETDGFQAIKAAAIAENVGKFEAGEISSKEYDKNVEYLQSKDYVKSELKNSQQNDERLQQLFQVEGLLKKGLDLSIGLMAGGGITSLLFGLAIRDLVPQSIDVIKEGIRELY